MAAIIFQSLYLLFAKSVLDFGFPLDDAWIHQTYARNLATYWHWEFIPGQVSGGSTSPLWTLLLVPGHWLPKGYFLGWTFFISFCLYAGSAFYFNQAAEKIMVSGTRLPIYGLIFLSEWHLIWATNSGMETILLIFFYMLLTYWIVTEKTFSWKFALVSALLIWVRPDAITFIGVFGLIVLGDIFLDNGVIRNCWKIITLVVGSTLLYGLFNFIVTGTFFPNTFYAKQAEYSVLFNTPLNKRLGEILLVPITGIGAILLPGWLFQIYDWIKTRNRRYLAIVIWMFAFLLLYAVRLPVTYQHGRYFIPIIPIYLLTASTGLIRLIPLLKGKIGLAISKSWQISLVIVAVIFLFLGAKAYALDVAIINSEMVAVSQWISENTKPSAIVAAHDIGALGFYSNRRIIDLAGLITPEVIPIITNEDLLINYLDEKGTNYLMTFPDWYSDLVRGKSVVFESVSPFVITAGGTHMTVYDWQD